MCVSLKGLLELNVISHKLKAKSRSNDITRRKSLPKEDYLKLKSRVSAGDFAMFTTGEW